MNRVTLRKTLTSCALLGAVLLLVIISMSLLGSERLPARASLCALASLGTSACGLTQDQFDILFQIRLPRILLAAAVGGSLQLPVQAIRRYCETRSPSLISSVSQMALQWER